jgi:bacteriorhodopsin
LVRTHYKWGFFAFGTFAYFLLAYSLLTSGLATAKRIGINSHYLLTAGWLVFIWMIYPIAFGVDDGGNKIGVTEGFIFFGILDVLTVPLLSAGILLLATRWDYREMNLYFTQYGRVPPPSNSEFPEREKVAPAAETPVIDPEQAV